MLKQLLTTTAIVVGAAATAAAQIDASLNLTGIAANNPQVAGEYAVADKFGVEFGIGTALGTEAYSVTVNGATTEYEWDRRGVLATLQAKCYFNPGDAIEGFYGSLYSRFRNVTLKDERINGEPREGVDDLKINRLAVGAALGYKAVVSRFILEAAAGAGFAPVSDNEYLQRFDGGIGFFDSLDNLDLYARASVGFRIVE